VKSPEENFKLTGISFTIRFRLRIRFLRSCS